MWKSITKPCILLPKLVKNEQQEYCIVNEDYVAGRRCAAQISFLVYGMVDIGVEAGKVFLGVTLTLGALEVLS